VINSDRFTRIKMFGENKNKLAMLLFNQKVQDSMINLSKDETQEINHKRLSLELTEEEEKALDAVYNEIQSIKKRYDFANLENYVSSVLKNFSAIDKAEVIDLERLRGFLENFCLSNFFKQTPQITNINFLNFKDELFVRRSDFIITVG